MNSQDKLFVMVSKTERKFIAEKAKELVSLDVSIIGGCCAMAPEHIRIARIIFDLQK